MEEKLNFININLLLEMSETQIKVEKMEVKGENVAMSKKEKVLRYLHSQQELAYQSMQRYEAPMEESMLSQYFIVGRQEARVKFDTIVQIKSMIEMLFLD